MTKLVDKAFNALFTTVWGCVCSFLYRVDVITNCLCWLVFRPFFADGNCICVSVWYNHPGLYADIQPVSTVTVNSRCLCNRGLTGTSCTRQDPVVNKQQHKILPWEQHLHQQHSVSLPSVWILLPFVTQLCYIEAGLRIQTGCTEFDLSDKVSKSELNNLPQLGMFVHL